MVPCEAEPLEEEDELCGKKLSCIRGGTPPGCCGPEGPELELLGLPVPELPGCAVPAFPEMLPALFGPFPCSVD